MSEFHKIAVGLLGMSHPEIYRSHKSPATEAAASAAPRGASLKPTPAAVALRAVKFAFAALLAGSRAIPLGDNGRLTRELGEYGAHLRRC